MTTIVIEYQGHEHVNDQKFVRLHRETQSMSLPLLLPMPTHKEKTGIASKHFLLIVIKIIDSFKVIDLQTCASDM